MAWAQTDLDAVEAAIASGEVRVRYSDGQEVFYRSVAELSTAREMIKGALGAAKPTSCTYGTFSKD